MKLSDHPLTYLVFVPLAITTLVLICVVILNSCSVNVSMAHTEGTATDTIDDTQSNTPNVSPTITIPPIPGVV